MDVTRKNFYTLLPDLQKAVSEAEFIAIDLEFSGLSSGGRELEAMPFDTPRQYYEKVYQRALDFLPLQLGACIFRYDSDKDRYAYQAFNFYLFPFSKLRGFPNCTFQCQSSSLAFLSSCGFDFNKAIGEGIPFLTQIEEDKLRSGIKERQQKMGSSSNKETPDIPIPDDQKVQLQCNIKKIREFLEDQSDTRENSMILDRCNGFMRRLLYQEVPKEFGDAALLETCEDLSFAMKVLRGGGEDIRKNREEEKKVKEWKEFEDAVGLSKFVKVMSESGKLIIGHNCLLDLCHVVNRFRYPLPPCYEDFKELLHHIFPRIIDTKYMSTANEFKDIITSSGLGHLMETLSEAPFEMPVVDGNVAGRTYSNLVDKSHEGGYDAYITGQCFLSMCQYFAKNGGKKLGNMDSIKDILSQFENRVYLMRVQDMPFIRLGGFDPKPPRNHVFHLRFPREWRQYEIAELFKPFGSVYISFIDDRSAFVALHKRDQAKVVLKTMTGSNNYKLLTFATYRKQCESKSPPLTNPGSPSTDIVRKRKLRETSCAPESPNIFKKHCSLEQPNPHSKRSIDPIPEEAETDPTGFDTSSDKSEVSKEFPVDEVWG